MTITDIAKERGYDTEMYGFRLDEIVELVVEVYDEKCVLVPAGTRIRLVAISPKVRIQDPSYDPSRYDRRAHFFNAVREEEMDFSDPRRKWNSELPYGARIRANFCTIRKIKKEKTA